MLTQEQIDLFLQYFFQSWNNSFQDLRAYNKAVAIAEERTGINFNLVKGAVPTYQSLVGGKAPASVGDVVGNANMARDEGANATRPPVGQEVLTPSGRITPAGSGAGSGVETNAVATPTSANNPTVGTDAEVRTISQTQATPQTLPNPFTNSVIGITPAASINGQAGATAPTGGPGAGAAPDDQRGAAGYGPSGTNALRNRLDQLYAGPTNAILAQDNILDQYPSYTYSLSWYLLDPESYNQISTSTKKNLNGYYLLAQSGGAPNTTGVYNPGETGPLAGTAGRSPYFNLDYYIDNFSVRTAFSAKLDSGGPAEYTTLEFTVTEPNGISLPQNLYAAMNDLYKAKGFIPPADQANYASGLFCMIVRFYGYDESGNLIQPIARNIAATDRQAAVEKYIFFTLSDLKYSVGSKLVEYKISGSHPSTNTAQSSNRGSIPADYQFSGATVRDILVGQIQQQTASQAAGDKTRNNVPVSATPPRGASSVGLAPVSDGSILDQIGGP